MKRIIALVLAAIFCSLTFCACSNENDSTKKDPIALSAREQLSKEEKKLYTYIMETIEEDFENPSAVRILDIGDLTEYGPKIIKVKFQGQTTDDDLKNPIYQICLKTGFDESKKDYIEIRRDRVKARGSMALSQMLNGKYYDSSSDDKKNNEDWAEIMIYEADEGDSLALFSGKIEKSQTDTYSIKLINEAIGEYWEEIGIN